MYYCLVAKKTFKNIYTAKVELTPQKSFLYERVWL